VDLHSRQSKTLKTPVELAESAPQDQCRRVVFSDLHAVDTGDVSDEATPFPDGCTDPSTPLTAQEKAIELMLFDLSACVGSGVHASAPPPIE
jgi:hypothetical protein